MISCPKVDPWSRWVTGPQQQRRPRRRKERERANPHLHEQWIVAIHACSIVGSSRGWADQKVTRKLCYDLKECGHVRYIYIGAGRQYNNYYLRCVYLWAVGCGSLNACLSHVLNIGLWRRLGRARGNKLKLASFVGTYYLYTEQEPEDCFSCQPYSGKVER